MNDSRREMRSARRIFKKPLLIAGIYNDQRFLKTAFGGLESCASPLTVPKEVSKATRTKPATSPMLRKLIAVT
jgi:hypothetical protein